MFKISKDSLLKLNEAMQKTIMDMNYDNPLEISAFASTMISVGNQINLEVIKDIAKNNRRNPK